MPRHESAVVDEQLAAAAALDVPGRFVLAQWTCGLALRSRGYDKGRKLFAPPSFCIVPALAFLCCIRSRQDARMPDSDVSP